MKLTESQEDELIMLIHLEFLSLGASPELIARPSNLVRLRHVVDEHPRYWFGYISLGKRFFDVLIPETKLELSMRRLTIKYLESIE